MICFCKLCAKSLFEKQTKPKSSLTARVFFLSLFFPLFNAFIFMVIMRVAVKYNLFDQWIWDLFSEYPAVSRNSFNSLIRLQQFF